MTAPDAPPGGVLVVDKPVGPTSHDVVARVRRALGTRRVGHTGTLDPLASGVLPVVVGAATRLARFLSATTKRYDAVVRLGSATDTGDRAGTPLAPPPGGYTPVPGVGEVAEALSRLVGTVDQMPPTFSAKKIGGVRAYALARDERAVVVRAVPVTLYAAEVLALDGVDLQVRLTCSAGYYVRALARDLGESLGCGGHLAALRRTASGWFTEAMACPLDEVEQAADAARARLVPLVDLLPWAPAAWLTPAGVERARHGNPVVAAEVDRWEAGDRGVDTPPSWREVTRLVGPAGQLVAIATRAADADGSLRPDVVLV